MKLVLDTHIWVRWVSADDPLDAKIVKMLEEADVLAVSSVSCWEVAYLVKRQRLQLPLSLSQWMRAALDGSDVEVIALGEEIAVMSANLPDVHRDPADRFIIATALTCRYQLVSYDERFKLYDVLKNRLIF